MVLWPGLCILSPVPQLFSTFCTIPQAMKSLMQIKAIRICPNQTLDEFMIMEDLYTSSPPSDIESTPDNYYRDFSHSGLEAIVSS